MRDNLISKRINNYFDKIVKKNNYLKFDGIKHKSFIKKNTLMIILLIIIIIIIFSYCYYNSYNYEKKINLKEKEFIKQIDKDNIINMLNEIKLVNEQQKKDQLEINYKMDYLKNLKIDKNNVISNF